MIGRRLVALLALVLTAPAPPSGVNAAPEWSLHRPKVAGALSLHLRERKAENGKVRVVEREQDWKAAETAVIVCDMWDDIYCRASARRIGVLVPKMNAALTAARDRGVMIIHAPSDCMNMYAETPQRLRMKNTEPVAPPPPIRSCCDRDPGKEPPLPLETTLSPCDDPITGAIVRRYSREHPGLDVAGFDGVSDDGREIFSYCRRQGIKNIILVGVHTNMCVLGRSFGVRQLVRLGFRVALVRDLTDAMYDPRQPPHVSHARGTELTAEHIETYLCNSIEAADLTRIPTAHRDDGRRDQSARVVAVRRWVR